MPDDITIRAAVVEDGPVVAAIHVASWQATYRGLLSDRFLDHEAPDERARHWAKTMLAVPAGRSIALLAAAGGRALGFAYVDLDGEPAFGALLDNLHVVPGETGRGIGRQLLGRAARWASDRSPGIGLHLHLLEGNDRAACFYERHGATRGERILLPGAERPVRFIRYGWPDAGRLALTLHC